MEDSLPVLIWKHRRHFLVATTLAMLAAWGVTLLTPKAYLSEASVLPVNSKMMDQEKLFGRNSIQDLYSAYGSSDDLDRLMAIMHSTAVLQRVADSLRLVDHYQLTAVASRHKAIKKLARNVRLKRTEYGDLQVMVWDRDPAMANALVEQILQQTQLVYDQMYISYYNRSIMQFQQAIAQQEKDSLHAHTFAGSNEMQFLKDRVHDSRIARVNKPPALFVLSAPVPAEIPDRPNLIFNLLVAAAAAIMTILVWLAGKSIWKSGYAKP